MVIIYGSSKYLFINQAKVNLVRILLIHSVIYFLFSVLVGCGESSPTGSPENTTPHLAQVTLAHTSDNAPNEACPNGGVTLNYGVDENGKRKEPPPLSLDLIVFGINVIFYK